MCAAKTVPSIPAQLRSKQTYGEHADHPEGGSEEEDATSHGDLPVKRQ
jgi:hypothetical protein